MKMYDIIAENYNRIFPLDADRINFVKSLLNPDDNFLDIGCGTGELCNVMAKEGYKAMGIDLNSRMIEMARKQQQENAEFHVMDMLEIAKHFSSTDFALISCFGNTLPHLDSLKKMADFFQQVHSRLTPEGYFVFQILNYNKILNEGKCDFPEIKTADFAFKRHYEFLAEKIRFTIGLETGDQKMSDSTLLYPLKKEDALSLLSQSGFKNICAYKNYSQSPSDGEEFATLYLAKK